MTSKMWENSENIKSAAIAAAYRNDMYIEMKRGYYL
jgi:hypothetical protein